MIDRNAIEEAALSLLLRQKPKGEFFLSLIDYRHFILDGAANIITFSEYERLMGFTLENAIEGCTVKYRGTSLIVINDSVCNHERINWTVAHELGHIFLSHTNSGKREQREADLFAASFLIPEAVVRYLDEREGHKLSPPQMKKWFAASLTACKKRRDDIDRKAPYISEAGNTLVSDLFLI